MPKFWSRLPKLVRFMLAHAATGIAVGWGLMLAAIRFDVQGLGTLLSNSPDGGLATAILAAVFAVTFGSVGIGIGVMTLPWHDD
jgi:hypothetical protein